MGWTAVLSRKFPFPQGRIAEVNSRGTVLALAWLIVLLRAGYTATDQPAQSGIAAIVKVSAEDLVATPVGANWTSYNGDYSGQRYSSLREIKPENVAHLRAAWVFHPGNSERLETTPVVVNGIMYVTSANDTFALDARTGRRSMASPATSELRLTR